MKKRIYIYLLLFLFSVHFSFVSEASNELIEESFDNNGAVLSDADPALIEEITTEEESQNAISDDSEEEDVKVNYQVKSGFLQQEGTAANQVAAQGEASLSYVHFDNKSWEGSAFEFLADQHYAYAVYSNEITDVIWWDEGEDVNGVITPRYELDNGDVVFLSITDGSSTLSPRSILEPGSYTLQVKDSFGEVLGSQSVVITEGTTLVYLTPGEVFEFSDLSPSNLYVLSYDLSGSETEDYYPVTVSSEDGDYYIQCMWDDGEKIICYQEDIFYLQGENREQTSVDLSGTGTCYFMLKPVGDAEYAKGSFQISRPEDIQSVDITGLPGSINLAAYSSELGADLQDELAVSVTYMDETTEQLVKWKKDVSSRFFYSTSNSGKDLYLFLRDLDGNDLSLSSGAMLPLAGEYKWSLEQKSTTGDSLEVVAEMPVVLSVDGVVEMTEGETIEKDIIPGSVIPVSCEVSEGDTKLLRISSEAGNADDLNAMFINIYRLQDGSWKSFLSKTLWNTDSWSTALGEGLYQLFISGTGESAAAILFENEKEVIGLELHDELPEEIILADLMADSDSVLPSSLCTVDVTYDDNTEENVDTWEVSGSAYSAVTSYGNKIQLLLTDDQGSPVTWSRTILPKEGIIIINASAGSVSSTPVQHTVTGLEADSISVGDISDYTVGEGGSVSYLFDCGNTDVYQFKYEAESDIDAVCAVYRITDVGLQRNDIWEIDPGKDHSLKLQEGRYYISSRFNSASAGIFKIDGRTKVIQLQLGGMNNTVYTEGEKLIIGDSETYIDPTGLTAHVLYENNAEETVALSDIDQAISLLNGQKISAGLLKMDNAGQPVSARVTHYREISDMLGVGNYAVVAIIDDDPYIESFIPITVKPVNSGNAEIGITWSISDGVLTVGLQKNHTKGEIPDYEYVQETPWAIAAEWYKPTKIVIGEGISSIGANSFTGLDNISDIKLPMSLQRIADNAFTDEAVYNADISYSGTQEQWNSLTQGTAFNDVEITSTHKHIWGSGKVTRPATINAAGVKTYRCPCGATKTESIPRLRIVEKITVSKKPTIQKPAAAKGKITVKWKHFKHTSKKTKPIWKKIKSVQVQCAADKAFKKIVKTTTVKKSKKSAKINGLKKKTNYYVRVRYFDGTGYSAWSKVKKVKTK